MEDTFVDEIAFQVENAVHFLCKEGHIGAGNLIALGCSTSEIGGGKIGKSGSPELGAIVVRAALKACAMHQVVLAVQCCEHLNRALVLPEFTAETKGYPKVTAIPYPHAGGSCAAAAWRILPNPALVEWIRADAGIDIGDTLIGMHLKPVAVPLRPPNPWIGKARLVAAFTRPKYIGGPRTHYTLEDD